MEWNRAHHLVGYGWSTEDVHCMIFLITCVLLVAQWLVLVLSWSTSGEQSRLYPASFYKTVGIGSSHQRPWTIHAKKINDKIKMFSFYFQHNTYNYVSACVALLKFVIVCVFVHISLFNELKMPFENQWESRLVVLIVWFLTENQYTSCITNL